MYHKCQYDALAQVLEYCIYTAYLQYSILKSYVSTSLHTKAAGG